jgi:hypothetical protein
MKSKYSLGLIVMLVLLLPTVTLADFKPLVSIPGVDGNANFNTYINALYALSISVAALLAVIKIIIAGVKWMLSDLVTSKSEAKSDMQGALLGLLIVISAVVVLNTINPQLTQTSLIISPVDAVPNRDPGAAAVVVVPPGAVLPAGEIKCATNCVDEKKACTDSKGQVKPYINSFGVAQSGSIVCSFGNEIPMTCDGIDVGDPMGKLTYVCDTQEADCTKKGGKITNQTESSFICIIPY